MANEKQDAVIASVQTPPRRRDYAVVSEFYRNAEIPIWKWVTADHFEGGDFDIIKPGHYQHMLSIGSTIRL